LGCVAGYTPGIAGSDDGVGKGTKDAAEVDGSVVVGSTLVEFSATLDESDDAEPEAEDVADTDEEATEPELRETDEDKGAVVEDNAEEDKGIVVGGRTEDALDAELNFLAELAVTLELDLAELEAGSDDDDWENAGLAKARRSRARERMAKS
jgi:hypothetical protein